MLTAYTQAAGQRALQVWVGIFDTENPPAVTFEINEVSVAPTVIAPMREIRDAMAGSAGRPINHRAIFGFAGLEPDKPYRLVIRAGTDRFALVARTLPAAVPQTLDGTFNLLLCSCYSQPDDASGLLGTIVSQIKLEPHLTLMLGDLIYGDLPLFEDLPDDSLGIAQKLGEKYRRNWTMAQFGAGGLGPVLTRAPVACVADDHEFWNNFPFRQTQLQNTWTLGGRKRWGDAATALHEDYELSGGAGGTQRIDVPPLSVLVVDMRSLRDDAFDRLMSDETLQAIRDWVSELVRAKRNGDPKYGVLVSGQALFVEAAPDAKRETVDAEMANYGQFTRDILDQIDLLAEEGIPLVYITGDVHWGRVSRGRDVKSNRVLLHEIIVSPARLIRVPFVDTAKEAGSMIRGIFGKPEPWPRHAVPSTVPTQFGKNGRFRLECDPADGSGMTQRGDQVAIVSFSKSGQGLDFTVSYYAITQDKALAKSRTTRPFQLRIN